MSNEESGFAKTVNYIKWLEKELEKAKRVSSSKEQELKEEIEKLREKVSRLERLNTKEEWLFIECEEKGEYLADE